MKDKNSQQKFVRITKVKTDKEMESVLIMAHLAICAVAYSVCFN
jgi:hypothetical protein